MKKALFLVVLLALSLTTSLSAVAEANLLSNADFENGVGGWFGDAAFSLPDWSVWGTSGARETNLNHTQGGTASVVTWHNDTGLFQEFSATAGETYSVSSYALTRSSDPATNWDGLLKVEWSDGSTNISEDEVGRFYGGVDAVDSWKQIQSSLVAPSSATLGRVVLYVTDNGGGATSGSVAWDDIDVEAAAVPEPASLMFLASGLIGIFGISRKR
jgi:hypothetical protein